MDYYSLCRGPLFHPGGFELTKRALEYCGFNEGAVIADIGCGTGETAKLIERAFPLKVLCVERKPECRAETAALFALPPKTHRLRMIF